MEWKVDYRPGGDERNNKMEEIEKAVADQIQKAVGRGDALKQGKEEELLDKFAEGVMLTILQPEASVASVQVAGSLNYEKIAEISYRTAEAMLYERRDCLKRIQIRSKVK